MGIPMENDVNRDPTKQAQEMIFSRKVQMTNHPFLFSMSMSFHKLPFKSIQECFQIPN